eukprot:3808404-Pleurochrysis_carterae.AAC.2
MRRSVSLVPRKQEGVERVFWQSECHAGWSGGGGCGSGATDCVGLAGGSGGSGCGPGGRGSGTPGCVAGI